MDHWEYLVVGKEVSESGTPHLQCYGILKHRLRMAALSPLLPRAHLEKKMPKSTPLQASNYCKKGEQTKAEWTELGILGPHFGLNADFFEHGELPERWGAAGGQATKRNWDTAMELAKMGKFDEMDNSILFPHYSAAKRIRQDYQRAPPPLETTCGYWFVGPPGTGKSHAARERYPDFYDKPCNKWWDGYQDEETAIIDDFDLNHVCLGHYLKRWSDKYAFPAEHKGTTIQIRPKRIVVTSNYTIDRLFGGETVLAKALGRRFVVERFDEVYVDNECTTTEEF